MKPLSESPFAQLHRPAVYSILVLESYSFSLFSFVLLAYPFDLRWSYFTFTEAALVATLHDDDTHDQKPSAPMEVK
jgi:hypothetical protein